ncbi:MAG TPA: hypothetical protein VN873_07455 [Candidatus Angelobacter sp.]|nr:hypothetical protein [Candidatus Angelobacter sp.]
MRIIYLILAVLVVSCASPKQQPVVVLEQHADSPPNVCNDLVAAINHGDWAKLRALAKPGTAASESTNAWEQAMKAGHPVQVGKFLNVQTVAAESKKPYKLYSFALENKDGTVNPHWLQIKVQEEHGQPEVQDFWIFGW